MEEKTKKKKCPYCGHAIEKNFRSLSEVSEHLLDVIADKEGVTVSQIISRERSDKIVVPRHIYMYVMRIMYPEKSLSEIGSSILRHHTSVLHGYRNIRDYVEVDKVFRGKVTWYLHYIKDFALGKSQIPQADPIGQNSVSPGS